MFKEQDDREENQLQCDELIKNLDKIVVIIPIGGEKERIESLAERLGVYIDDIIPLGFVDKNRNYYICNSKTYMVSEQGERVWEELE